MKSIDRVYHICLTVSTDQQEEMYPRLLDFYTNFLKMNAFRIRTEEMRREEVDTGMAGIGIGEQKPLIDEKTGKEKHLEIFHYVCGEDTSELATLMDFITFTTEPGQMTRPLTAMNLRGLRGMTLLVDDIAAIYARGQDEGIEFISEPVEADWGSLGKVQFAVLRDPMGNPVELVQAQPSSKGAGKVLRIFSININTADSSESLAFYRDGCGMTVEHEVEFAEENMASAMGVESIAATSYYLAGTNPDAQTWLCLTEWASPDLRDIELPEGVTPSWYRMFLWLDSKQDVHNMFDKMRPSMRRVIGEPFDFYTPPPFEGTITMGMFEDPDTVVQEFAYKENWTGLQTGLDLEAQSKTE